jgi:MFS family permease
MYAELFVIVGDIISGPIIDILGRKYPVVIGFFVASIFTGLIPLFTEVYPYFFICRVMTAIGTIFFLNVPILPDYVHIDYIGTSNGISAVTVAIASLFTGSVLL